MNAGGTPGVLGFLADHLCARAPGPGAVRLYSVERRGAKWASQPLLALATLLLPLTAVAIPPEQVEFFENHIRPVLAQDCYECHNSQGKAKGKLILDHRAGLLKGGGSGPAIVPGKAEESLLIQAIRHEVEDLEMPKAGVRLDEAIIQNFVKWVNMGAPDPRDAPPAAEELATDTAWPAIMERRKSWWSFQPIANPAVPAGEGHPVDRFVREKLAAQGLEASGLAELRTLARRLYLTLIGLPPTPEQVADFVASGPGGTERLIDELLASPHFGERWARHWMDWVRYAESHGSEGDPEIESAWEYRDYLIRALNADIAYDVLLREHVAGDLLETPRVNAELGLEENQIATAHWRMVQHGFAPTDALDEKVRFTDDQINVFSKAFLGLTVSCARCHNHKFDAISQADYYAFFGILGSTRPSRVVIDVPERTALNRDALAALKPKIRVAVANDWLNADLAGMLSAKQGGTTLLKPWAALRGKNAAEDFAAAWHAELADWQQDARLRKEHAERPYWKRWNLGNAADYASWYRDGSGLPERPAAAGEFAVASAPEKGIAGIYPAGVYTNLLSDKHAARLASADVRLDGEYKLFVRILGGGGAMSRYVVQNYPRNGTVYPVSDFKEEGKWKWQEFDVSYWNGDDVHVELATARDAPLLVKPVDRSWFGIQEAVLLKKGDPAPPAETREYLDPVFEGPAPVNVAELSGRYVTRLREAISAWRDGAMSDSQASMLNMALAEGLLPNAPAQMAEAGQLIAAYQKLEAAIPAPRRVPGIAEWKAHDQPLYDRGDHKKPAELVPRRFLDAVDPTPFQTAQSGRKELAEDLLRADNPLTRRVIVNRLWHHLFGAGLVSTPDNLGRLGVAPTHPELLDYLAARFSAEDHWSLKSMIRFLVTSQTWQQASEPSAVAAAKDPANQWLSHFGVRRLEAEAIRDSLLAVSGKLEDRMFGLPDGGNSGLRSVYVRVRRNSLDPFLSTFDAPVPFSATGRRDVTNVPSQSLLMMNSGFVEQAARSLSDRFKAMPDETSRVRKMWETALGRPPGSEELAASLDLVRELKARYAAVETEIAAATAEISSIQKQRAAILSPVREKLQAELDAKAKPGTPTGPAAIAHWTFDGTLEDAIGKLEGRAVGQAHLENGALVVNGEGLVATEPLDRDLKERTLEALVMLDGLEQRGGGVMTVQDLRGGVFDSIVFGEQAPGRWLAGSNGFVRTEPLDGLTETEAGGVPVRLAIAYDADGTIRAYRNGLPYGAPYRKAALQVYPKGDAQVMFGIRHGTGTGGNRMLRGRILEAKLYDRALSPEEVSAAAGGKAFLSEAQVLAALSAAQRDEVARLEASAREVEARRLALGRPAGPEQAWIDLAQSVLNLKEFIYLR